MKRSFHESDQIDNLSMANCLMLLSQRNEILSFPSFEAIKSSNFTSNTRIFECKTCNRQFTSFQALGGHRASHKKPRLMINGELGLSLDGRSSSPAKPKTHECSICGLEFAIGQALGGHMRRHRSAAMNNTGSPTSSIDQTVVMKPSVLKKSNSKRVLCLDLNLTPHENDLELFKIW